MRYCVDLFAGLGGFSAAFERDPSWDVTTVDVNPDFDPDICADVFELSSRRLPDADIVLASPPCPVFSSANNVDHFNPNGVPKTERARRHVQLAYYTVGLASSVGDYWFIENPRGKLKWFLGESQGTVTYCQYGRDYMKPTHLWGNHPEAFEYRSCTKGSDCHVSNTETDGTSAVASMPRDRAERSKVPYKLSLSILESVKRSDGQRQLNEVVP